MPDEASPGSDARPGVDPSSSRLTFEERLEKALAAHLEEFNTRFASPNRPQGKPTGLKAIPATAKGDEVEVRLGRKLTSMLATMALIRANRRRATAIDTTDFEAAFDDLINPDPRPKWLDVLADVATLLGGGFLGYAINVMTGDHPAIPLIAATLLSGLSLGIGAMVIKSKKLR